MRRALSRVGVAVVLVAVSACTSSGGTKAPAGKSGAEWFQARPLIMAGQHVTTVHADAFASLRPPTSEDAYRRLTPAQQSELASALRGVDCAHPPQLKVTADRVLCDAGSDAFLLGPPVFTGNDVTRAKPLPPSPSVADWSLSLSLTASAGKKLYRWTSQHHVTQLSGAFNDVQTSSQPPCGTITTTPCSYFTAYISGTEIVALPVLFAAVEKTIVVPGFSPAVAPVLARRLSG